MKPSLIIEIVSQQAVEAADTKRGQLSFRLQDGVKRRIARLGRHHYAACVVGEPEVIYLDGWPTLPDRLPSVSHVEFPQNGFR
jgi:hypothetical protein